MKKISVLEFIRINWTEIKLILLALCAIIAIIGASYEIIKDIKVREKVSITQAKSIESSIENYKNICEKAIEKSNSSGYKILF